MILSRDSIDITVQILKILTGRFNEDKEDKEKIHNEEDNEKIHNEEDKETKEDTIHKGIKKIIEDSSKQFIE